MCNIFFGFLSIELIMCMLHWKFRKIGKISKFHSALKWTRAIPSSHCISALRLFKKCGCTNYERIPISVYTISVFTYWNGILSFNTLSSYFINHYELAAENCRLKVDSILFPSSREYVTRFFISFFRYEPNTGYLINRPKKVGVNVV